MSKFAPFNSKFMSFTIDKESSQIAFFGIESGGRDRDKHESFNLALPSHGGMVGAFKKNVPLCVSESESEVAFENGEGARARYTFDGEKTLSLDIEKPLKSDIFGVSWSIKVAPPTIWSKSVCGKSAPKNLKTKNPLVLYKNRYSLPLIIHFPDFGRLEISSSSESVYCIEELVKSSDFTGLGLGYLNHDIGHNDMYALHFGASRLTLKSKNPLERVSLKFKVLDEVYPTLPFDASGSEWNGLKRCFLNSFALNREFFDMGDNIYLNGMGHLSVHMKSDLLQIMGEDFEQFKMIRAVFERQIINSFKRCQADDGEVNFDYRDRKKGNVPMCSFIDSTPSAIIALAGISHWNMPLAKSLIPYAKKALDFLMSLDSDGDGIIEVPFPGDYIDKEKELGYRQRNWWDNFAFGHKDIYFNYLFHRALRELSELLCKIGRASEATAYLEMMKKFEASFFDTFYNKESGVMAGWISRDGKIHDYMFTFAVSMGIDEGLIPLDKGKEMMKILLDKMDELGYGDLRFGIPGNLISVTVPDTFEWPCMTDWGQYENGGLCGMNGFHFITALYKVGLDSEGDKILGAILNTYEKAFTHSGLMPGYAQSVDWRTKDGVACGYNYLADNYYFLLSAYTGKGKLKHSAVVV